MSIRNSFKSKTWVILGIITTLFAVGIYHYLQKTHPNIAEATDPPISYTFTVTQPTGGTITLWSDGVELSPDEEISAGTSLSIRATPNNGKAFKKWLCDLLGELPNSPLDHIVNGPLSICAEFEDDTEPPVITLIEGDITHECGDTFTDPGVIITDNSGEDLSESLVVGGDTVDENTPDTYVITYDVDDEAGNSAIQVSRTVTVEDTTIPVISLLGMATPPDVAHGSIYTDAGATASDSCEGDLTNDIVTVNPVDTNTVGEYTVTYNVSDGSGNDAVEVTRTVNVTDQTAPDINLLVTNPLTIHVGDSYSTANYTATDNVDGDITANVTLGGDTVNPDLSDIYVVSHDVSDSASNAATQVELTVNVDSHIEVDRASDNGYVEFKPDGTTLTQYTANEDVLVRTPTIIAEAFPDEGFELDDWMIGNVHVMDDFEDGDLMNGGWSAVAGNWFIDTGAMTTSLSSNTAATVQLEVMADDGEINLDYKNQDTSSNTHGFKIAPRYSDENNFIDVAIYPDRMELNETISGNETTLDSDTSTASTTQSTNYSVRVRLDGANVEVYRAEEESSETLVLSTTSASLLTAVNSRLTILPNANIFLDNANFLGGDAAYLETANPATALTMSQDYTLRPYFHDSRPVITLNGDNPMTVAYNGIYTEPGATAVDDVDGDITGDLTIAGDMVTPTIAGSYFVTYDVSDAASHSAIQVVREVIVPDVTPPTLALLGDNPFIVEYGQFYSEPGAIATDNLNGDISHLIQVTGSINSFSLGTYTRYYDVSDAAGNSASQKSRKIIIIDSNVPSILVEGENPTNVDYGTTYVDAGATAYDLDDGDITTSIITDLSNVDTSFSMVGNSFTVTYDVTDSNSNDAVQLTRTVNVIDPAIPLADGAEGTSPPSTPSFSILTNTAEIWVDYAFLGDSFGTEDRPYKSIALAQGVVDNGGVIKVKSGASNETPYFDTAVTVKAVGGPVTSGDSNVTVQTPGLEGAVIATLDISRSRYDSNLHTGIFYNNLRVAVADAGATTIEIATIDATSLLGVDIFFGGLLSDTAAITATEQTALSTFVNDGGGLLAFTEHGTHTTRRTANEPLLTPFGVSSIMGFPTSNVTTITDLNHPVTTGRFGPVDNGSNQYTPSASGRFIIGTAQVIATTSDGDGAILTLEQGEGRAVFFNDSDIVTSFSGATGTGAAIMNAFLYVYNPPKLTVTNLDVPEEIKEGEMVLISEVPEMPNIQAKIQGFPSSDEAEMSLAIRYIVNTPIAGTSWTKIRNDETFIPDPENTFKTFSGAHEWKLQDENEYDDVFMGGEATFYYRLDPSDPIEEMSIKVLGDNPDDADVLTYISTVKGTYWFADAIARHESVSAGEVFSQFNPLTSAESVAGLPNYGGPDGWGIMQLDGNGLGRDITIEELWNWKTNIDHGIDVIDSKVAALNEYVDAMQRIYPNEFEDPRTPNLYTHSVTVNGDTKVLTFDEASIIQRYNTGRGIYDEWGTDGNGDPVIIRSFAYAWEFIPSAPAGSRWVFGANTNGYVQEVMEEHHALYGF